MRMVLLRDGSVSHFNLGSGIGTHSDRRVGGNSSGRVSGRSFHNLLNSGRGSRSSLGGLGSGSPEEGNLRKENHHDPGDHQAENTHDNAGNGHAAGIGVARSVGKCVRRRRDRQAHAERACKGNRHEEGGHATQADQVVLAGNAHGAKNRNKQGGRRSMAHEVRHEEADDTAANHQGQRRPACKRDSLDKVGGKTRSVEANTQGKTTGHEPEHVPAHGVQVFLGNHAGQGEHGHRNHGDGIVVDTVDILTGHPQNHAKDKGNVNDNGLGAGVELARTFDVQDHLFHLDGINLEEENPGYHHEDNHVGDTKGHPLAKCHGVCHQVAAGHGVVQGTEGNGVRRRSDRGTHAADVGAKGNSEGKGCLTAVIGFKELEHRSENGKHHGGGGGIAHEHGEHGGNEHKAQKHELRVLAEGLQKDAGQVQVHLVLGGCSSEEEAAQEKHDDGVCEGGHDGLVADHGHAVHAERRQGRVGHGHNHEHDDQHRRGPNRERLQNPEKGGHHEYADDADFEGIQDSHGACGIEPEGFVGQEEGDNRKDRRDDELDEFSLCHSGPKCRNYGPRWQ